MSQILLVWCLFTCKIYDHVLYVQSINLGNLSFILQNMQTTNLI